MADKAVLVLDRENVPRSYSRSVLRKQLLQGNLSEKMLISQNGEYFEPLESAGWFFDDEPASSGHGMAMSSIVCVALIF